MVEIVAMNKEKRRRDDFEIEFEPIITERDVQRIMTGDNDKLKAELWNLIHRGGSRVRRGRDLHLAGGAANTLERAEPILEKRGHTPGKHGQKRYLGPTKTRPR